jgi:hypothetical protein
LDGRTVEVGIGVRVEVGVLEGVDVEVFVGVSEGVIVGVCEGVKDAVGVLVFVGVEVNDKATIVSCACAVRAMEVKVALTVWVGEGV